MATPPTPIKANPPNPIRAAYWNSDGPVPDTRIPDKTFTHIYYAFLQPDPTTFKLIPTPEEITRLTKFFSSVRVLKPPVKALLSIGGANNNLDVFDNMASTDQNREAFILSSIATARKYEFDGVDLDWEYPRNEVEMTNLGMLYQHWKEALEHDSIKSGKPRLLLTSVVYYASEVDIDGPPRAYPASKIADYVDWVSPKCYDYYTSRDNFTAAHAALRDPRSNKNTKNGIESWIQADVLPSKLVMGIPLYGRSWTLQDPANNGIWAPAKGVPGETSFRDIAASNATVKYDETTVSYYCYLGRNWTGYDDIRSVEAKVEFAKCRPKPLAGYFFRFLGQDTEDWTLSTIASDVWENKEY